MLFRYGDLDARWRLTEPAYIARRLVEQIAGSAPMMLGTSHVAGRQAADRADLITKTAQVVDQALKLLLGPRHDPGAVAFAAHLGCPRNRRARVMSRSAVDAVVANAMHCAMPM
jgi:hypothetical protein